jgi:hypothetical protein
MTRGLKAILVIGLFTGLFETAAAQEPAPGRQAGEEQAQAAKRAPKGQPDSDQTGLRAGTKITAELQSSLDAKTAKPGDEVSARVTQNVKENGRVVVRKGDRLVGEVTEVKSGAEANGGSALGVTFNRLMSGSETTRVNAVLASIISTPSEMRSDNEGGEAPEPVIAPGPAPARAGGGLVGRAASTVGATTGTVGGATGGLGSTVGSTTSGTLGGTTGAMVSTPIRAVRVSSATSAQGSAQSRSVLSTRQGNLHLESGTRMQFRVASNEQVEAK